MAKVLLTTTPWQPFHTLRSLFPNIPPLGLQILSAALREAGHEPFIADVQHLPPMHLKFVKMVEHFGPDVIVFTNNCMANTPVILRVARELRSLFGGLKNAIGGQVPSFRPEYFLAGESPAFDAAGLFEGEQVIAPLIDALHRVLWLMEHRPAQVEEFLREAQPNLEQMRLVAQALAGPALGGGELVDVSPTGELAALRTLTSNWRSVIGGLDAVFFDQRKEGS